MNIAVIQASSQIEKNELLYSATSTYAKEANIINFGCFEEENITYSYIEVALLIGLLIQSKVVDFVVTGCSSGQGMMLACNSIPGILCGYTPTPKDAYLFAQINNGNVVSLPLGEEYTYQGQENLFNTIQSLFSEPFGGGYPKSEAQRKIRDSLILKEIKQTSQKDFLEFFDCIDPQLIQKILTKKNVIDYILENSTKEELVEWIKINMTK